MDTVETLPEKSQPEATRPWWSSLARRISTLSWQRLRLVGLLTFTAWLYLFRLENLGYNNEYYASAVKSMLASWSNFFFASFDPAGFISVDKPPVFLWVQAAFAWLLGYSGLSMLLPQALAGIGSVWLVYHLVRRVFGPVAGLLAGFTLAITPIFMVTSRHNNPESLLILALLAQVWALTKAVETGKLRWVMALAGLGGLAFNIKMLEAFVTLPAFFLVYLLMGRGRPLKRVMHLTLATLVLLVVSLSWAVAVDSVPPGQRPFVGSSTNNSELNLILGYNGLGRTEGSEGSPGSSGNFSTFSLAGQAGIFRLFMNYIAGEVNWLFPLVLFGLVALVKQGVAGWKSGGLKNPRNTALLAWGGWLATFWLVFSFAKGTIHPYYLVMLAPPLAALFGAGLPALWQEYKGKDWAWWLLPAGVFLNALYQVYILWLYPGWNGQLSFAMVAFCLIGVISLVENRLNGKASKIGLGFSFALLAAPLAWSLNQLFVTPFNPTLPSARPGVETNTDILGNRYLWDNVTQPFGGDFVTNILPSLALLAVSLLAIAKLSSKIRRPGVARPVLAGGVVLLVAVGVAGFAFNTSMPKASRANLTKLDAPALQLDQKLVSYLTVNTQGQAYLAAVMNTTQAAPLILATGRPVLAIGGYMGIDPTLTVAQAEQLVKENKLRFFLVAADNAFGNVSAEAGTSAIYAWASQKCQPVDPKLWQTPSSGPESVDSPPSGQLFDCFNLTR